ncbi:hypothetical protein GSI_05447 [Ganoderma sinense ZZ0214-1]|uniref:Uncharacterized protein n=1 Tax=Ganoderma sinense ZZ0214-1 TaxID=1077348 RepID=A0A2G8SEK2_9APHY|nr:hypothetical protein GSI_05447 [Ganoderma sinense ZZ0214-1]
MAGPSSYQAVDALVSSNFSIYSASVSRPPASERPSDPAHLSASGTNGVNGQQPDWISEREPLLGSEGSKRKPFYRPRPLWTVRVAEHMLRLPYDVCGERRLHLVPLHAWRYLPVGVA